MYPGLCFCSVAMNEAYAAAKCGLLCCSGPVCGVGATTVALNTVLDAYSGGGGAAGIGSSAISDLIANIFVGGGGGGGGDFIDTGIVSGSLLAGGGIAVVSLVLDPGGAPQWSHSMLFY